MAGKEGGAQSLIGYPSEEPYAGSHQGEFFADETQRRIPVRERKANHMSKPLITVDAALHALASANTPDELLMLIDYATDRRAEKGGNSESYD